MKEFLEKIWDAVYDYIDYIIMFTIVLIVAGIIGWRLDIIFTTTTRTSSKPPIEVANNDDDSANNGQAVSDPDEVNQSDESEDEESDDSTDTDDSDNGSQEEEVEEEKEEKEEEAEETEDENIREIRIEIPSGTMPPKIASILLNSGLIDDADAFLKRAEELNIQTRLKAGTFSIPSNSSVDEILRILSR